MSTELSEDERELRHTPDSSVFTSCSLIDKNGSSTELKSLLSPSSTLLLVFVRHWGCAACQEYITVLSKHLNRDDLAKYRASVVIVGHGKYTLIENYRSKPSRACWGEILLTAALAEITGTTFDIYTTPDRTIHDKLGFGQMTFTSIFTNPLPGYSDKSNLSIIGTALKVRRLKAAKLTSLKPLYAAIPADRVQERMGRR